MSKKTYILFFVYFIFGLVCVVMGIQLRADLLFLLVPGIILILLSIWIFVDKVVLLKKRCTQQISAIITKCVMEERPIEDEPFTGNYYVTAEYQVSGQTYKESFIANGFQLLKSGIEKLENGMNINILINPTKPKEAFYMPDYVAPGSISGKITDAVGVSTSGLGSNRWYFILILGIILLAYGLLDLDIRFTIMGLVFGAISFLLRKRQKKQPNQTNLPNSNPPITPDHEKGEE